MLNDTRQCVSSQRLALQEQHYPFWQLLSGSATMKSFITYLPIWILSNKHFEKIP